VKYGVYEIPTLKKFIRSKSAPSIEEFETQMLMESGGHGLSTLPAEYVGFPQSQG
jgi:hypothetical protein